MASVTGASLILFFLTCAVGILLSAVCGRKRAPLVIAVVGTLSSLLMVLASATVLLTGRNYEAQLWTLDGLGRLTLRLDALSSIFLLAAGIVYFSISLFVRSFVKDQMEDAYPTGRYGVLNFALMASVVLILVASDAPLFLIAWECMSILCFLLLNYEMRQQSDKMAGYIMLAMSEAGFLAVAVAFLILGRMATDFSFSALRAAAAGLSPQALWSVFLLGFFGFGVKAGLVPVNFWLPRSYTAAAPVFIPVFAGVTLNLGFYGILRLNADLVHTSYGTGVLALIVGSITALVGILYATTDNDMKTMLAHSSIENAGIIVAGLGAFLIYRASGQPVAAAIALSASLYHMVNHSIYKTLLFQGTAYVEAETGTRDMDQLGGLIKWMPLTALGFLAGTLSIAALPPFNGFVSEWLTLQVMLRSAELSSSGAKIVFALCGAGLALTAALAVTCFVKVFAMSFLGMRRLDEERRVSEADPATLASLTILAVLCLAFGVLPTYVIPSLDRASMQLAGASASAALVPPFFATAPAHDSLPPAFVAEFHDLGAQVGQRIVAGRGLVVLHRGGAENPVVFAMSTSYMLPVLIGLLLLTYVVIRVWLTRSRRLTRRERWDGGVRRLLPEMTYTATGFSNPVRVIFDAIFRPTTIEDTSETVAEHFRMAIRREKERVHLVDRLVFQPVRSATLLFAHGLAAMHRGHINAYSAYVLLALLLALAAGLMEILWAGPIN